MPVRRSYLRITSDAAEAVAAIDAVVAWLLEEQIIAEFPAGEGQWGWQYREGPQWAKAFTPEDAAAWFRDAHGDILFGVRVRKEWWPAHALENRESQPCPRCGVPLPGNTVPLLSDWDETRVEPTVTCSACGHRDLVGNFVSENAGYASYATLTFDDTMPLADEFAAELLLRIGGRSRWVETWG